MTPELDNVGIVGGQFALYGYAAALENVAHKSLLCLRPHTPLSDRQKRLAGGAQWVDDLDELAERCQTLIIAVPPAVQFKMLDQLTLKERTFTRLIIEKPIAPTPPEARLALRNAHELAGLVTVGYLFLYTSWFAEIYRMPSQSIDIKWSFQRSKVQSNWKMDRSQGGGLVAFFGIHLLPICYALGFTKVRHAHTTAADTGFELLCEHPESGRTIHIAVDSNATSLGFEVVGESNLVIYRAAGPFGTPRVTESTDYRTEFITRMLLAELPLSPEELLHCVDGSVEIWAQIEELIPA